MVPDSVVKIKAPTMDDSCVNKIVEISQCCDRWIFRTLDGGSKIRLGLNDCENGSVSTEDPLSLCKEFDDVTVDVCMPIQKN